MPHDYCFKWLPANPFPNILSWLSASSTPKDHSLPSLHKWIANHQLPSEHIQSTAETPQRNHPHWGCNIFGLFWKTRTCAATHSSVEVYEQRTTWVCFWRTTGRETAWQLIFNLQSCCANPTSSTQGKKKGVQPSHTIWTAACQTAPCRIHRQKPHSKQGDKNLSSA